ncbi:MAG: hypothetical protein ACE5O2_07465 [Armatimonadota bacterium]
MKRIGAQRCGVRVSCVALAFVGATSVGICADEAVSLQYKREVGEVERHAISVTGGGYAKDPLRTQETLFGAEIVVREEVVRKGPAGVATLQSNWESAKFRVDGQEARLEGSKRRIERRVNEWGEVLWVRERGREPLSTRGAEIDPTQLSLVDWLTDLVLHLQLPGRPVAVGDEWKVVERAEYEFTTAEVTKTSRLESIGTGDEAGTCSIATEITAPLELTFEQDGLRFTGEVGGSLRHRFDYRTGRLVSGHARVEIDLTGGPGEAPEAPAGETAFGTEFAVKMAFTIDVTSKRVREGKARKRR